MPWSDLYVGRPRVSEPLSAGCAAPGAAFLNVTGARCGKAGPGALADQLALKFCDLSESVELLGELEQRQIGFRRLTDGDRHHHHHLVAATCVPDA